MKKISLLVFAVVLAASSNVFAQSKNVIKMNLWSPIVSTWNFAYERVLNEKTAVQLGFAFISKKVETTKYSGFQIQPEVRFYLSESKEAPSGFYIAPFFRYRSLSLADQYTDFEYDVFGNWTGNYVIKEAKATWTSIGGGLVIGGQWLFANDHVAFGVFAGPAYYSHGFKFEGDADEDNFSLKGNGGFAIRSGVTLGVAF
jgi:hypothetical protein